MLMAFLQAGQAAPVSAPARLEERKNTGMPLRAYPWDERKTALDPSQDQREGVLMRLAQGGLESGVGLSGY